MKISARNVLKGKIAAVEKGATTARVKIEVGPGQVVTSSITRFGSRNTPGAVTCPPTVNCVVGPSARLGVAAPVSVPRAVPIRSRVRR